MIVVSGATVECDGRVIVASHEGVLAKGEEKRAVSSEKRSGLGWCIV